MVPLRQECSPLLFSFFSAFWPHPTACRIPAPLPGREPVPSAGEVRCLNHRATRKSQPLFLMELQPVWLWASHPAVSHSTLQTAIHPSGTPQGQICCCCRPCSRHEMHEQSREQVLKDRRWAEGREALMQLPKPGHLDGTWEQVREAATLTHENQVPGLLSGNEVTQSKKCGIIVVIIKLWVMWGKGQHCPCYRYWETNKRGGKTGKLTQ